MMKEEGWTNIPHICKFWYTNALFRPLKVHQKKLIFATGKTGHNKPRLHSLCKKAHGLEKKYTAAGSGGSDWFELCEQTLDTKKSYPLASRDLFLEHHPFSGLNIIQSTNFTFKHQNWFVILSKIFWKLNILPSHFENENTGIHLCTFQPFLSNFCSVLLGC